MADNVSYFVGAQGYVWDASANAGAGGWVKAIQAGGGGAGDASAANQVTGNASLASIDGKLPALASGRIPVVLPAGGGGLTDTELRAAAVPVSGAFFQATQPVSLASMPSTPVTGTFWQATQPVSGPVTDTQLRASAVPVSGTFWQGTQPVSAASLPLPAGASTEATLALIKAKTDNLDVLLSTRTKPADVQPVSAPTLTKGTQAANGWSVQHLKDAGRVNIMWTAEFSPAAVAEALLTLTESRDGAATTTFSSKVITTGKRLRITSIDLVVENTLGVNPKRAKLRLRFNTAGAVTTASPLQGTWAASVATAVNTIGQTMFADFPDGIEYLGDGTKQIGCTLEFPDWVTAAQTGKVYVTIFAFEY